MNRIGERFEIQEPLAQGGMGMVYLGTDLSTGLPVAIKQLKRDLISLDPTLIERFRREGQALARLNHPNIIRSLAAFQDGGEHYLVMEYLSGGTLRGWLQREGRLPVHRVVAIALDLADALARAHHLKIIHRDIKPENVLLAADGTVRLTDFGVASTGAVGARLTEIGQVPGTFAYLAPEAFSDAPADARSDIWSFGVLLFELLTGRHPFDAQTLEGTMGAILSRPTPDLERLRPDSPVPLMDLIYRMLEKDRTLRIPSMRLVAAELEAILNGAPPMIPQYSTLVTSPNVSLTSTSGTNRTRLNHNLPAQGLQFIGRSAELEQIQVLLADPTAHLITLVGIGGMGKTRLAIEAARQHLDRGFADGLWFIDLSAISGPGQILHAIADTIGFSIFPGEDPRLQLGDYLRGKSMLIILDNCETVPDAAAEIGGLAEAAAGVRFLATSRERLNLQREVVFPVDGFPVPPGPDEAESAPDQPDTAATEPSAFSAEARDSAVELFIQGARRARPGFALAPEALPDVIRICRAVDGLPLGILLAAAWVTDLTIAEIADEVSADLTSLGSAMHDIPERHRSLWAIAEFSWSRVPAAEQAIFARLSVFEGGFSRDAAAAVTGASLRALMALGTRSLVRRSPSGRYMIHELLRQFGAAALAADPGAQAAALNAHTAYCVNLLARSAPALRGPRQFAALQAIEADLPNLRAAWDRLDPAAWLDALPEATFSLWYFYYFYRQPYDAGPWLSTLLSRLERAPASPKRDSAEGIVRIFNAFVEWQLAHHGAAGMNVSRGTALLAAGGDADLIRWGALFGHFLNVNMLMRFDTADEALTARQATLYEHYQAKGDTWAQAVARLCLCSTAFRRGDPVQGRAYGHDALRFARGVEDAFITGWVYTILSQHLTNAGFPDEALTNGQQAEAVFDRMPFRSTIVRHLFSMAQAYIALGEYEQAERCSLKVVAATENTGNRTRLFSAYALLNTTAWARDDVAAAARYAALMTQTARQGTSTNLLATALTSTAYAALIQGQYQSAAENLREAFELWQQIRDRDALIDVVIGFGFLYGAAYHLPEQGIALLGCALAAPGLVAEARLFATRFVNELRPLLPPESVEQALAAGAARPLEDAIADLALK